MHANISGTISKDYNINLNEKKKKNSMQHVLEKIFAYLLSIKSLKIYFQFLPIYISRKETYTNMYKTKKLINEFLNQVEYSI